MMTSAPPGGPTAARPGAGWGGAPRHRAGRIARGGRRRELARRSPQEAGQAARAGALEAFGPAEQLAHQTLPLGHANLPVGGKPPRGHRRTRDRVAFRPPPWRRTRSETLTWPSGWIGARAGWPTRPNRTGAAPAGRAPRRPAGGLDRRGPTQGRVDAARGTRRRSARPARAGALAAQGSSGTSSTSGPRCSLRGRTVPSRDRRDGDRRSRWPPRGAAVGTDLVPSCPGPRSQSALRLLDLTTRVGAYERKRACLATVSRAPSGEGGAPDRVRVPPIEGGTRDTVRRACPGTRWDTLGHGRLNHSQPPGMAWRDGAGRRRADRARAPGGRAPRAHGRPDRRRRPCPGPRP